MAGAGFGPLAGIDLSLNPGERLWLRGPAGSGKTLVLYLASGLLQPRQGSVSVGGKTPAPGRLAMLFQNPDYQLLAATVSEDVALNAASPESAAAAQEAAGCRSISDASLAELSPGQRRKAALAGVLAAEAPLVLLDAPCAGFDREEAGAVWSGVLDFLEKRQTAVLATGEPPLAGPADTTWEVAQWHSEAVGR
jgi:energy-coupling factor transporter ATP-binding protein EcfA2